MRLGDGLRHRAETSQTHRNDSLPRGGIPRRKQGGIRNDRLERSKVLLIKRISRYGGLLFSAEVVLVPKSPGDAWILLSIKYHIFGFPFTARIAHPKMG